MTTTRREFLRLAGSVGTAVACGATGASALVRPRTHQAGALPGAGKDGRRVVLLFLEGGNDGLNTVVPFRDDLYYQARPRLAIRPAKEDQLPVDLALHPALRPWHELYQAGRLSVLQNVGYPRPDLSHFVSRDIWHSGQRDADPRHSGRHNAAQRHSGWVGRVAEGVALAGLPPLAVGVQEAPLLLKSAATNGLTLDSLEGFALDAAPLTLAMPEQTGLTSLIAAATRSAQEASRQLRQVAAKVPAWEHYPDSALAERLQLLARLVRADAGPPVLWTQLGGFDTHAQQAPTHAALLGQLAGATHAFQADLARDGTDQRTLLLIYSEFGRRVAENGSLGTDHGVAGPMFALGPGVRGGALGPPPNLGDLEQGNLRPGLDFRAVFSEVVRDWLGWPCAGLFDGDYADGKGSVGLLA